MKEIELVKKEALRRGFSPRTINTYLHCLDKFFRQCHQEPKKVTKKDVYDYLDRMIERKRAGSTINVHLSALHFLFSQVLKKRLLVNVKYSKTPKRLPEVLSKEEAISLFDAIKNKKHKLMVILMYSAGLRISELLNLKVRDLNVNDLFGWVRQGKGNKDRRFIIAERIRRELLSWIKENSLSPDSLLFSNKGRRMHPNTLRIILNKAAKIAKLEKRVHPHILRHCFGTHFIENGYSETELQVLLGHDSIQTTMIYTHVANSRFTNARGPYDTLNKLNETKAL